MFCPLLSLIATLFFTPTKTAFIVIDCLALTLMQVISSRVSVYGSLLFKDNSNSESSVQDHGTMYVTSQGQVQLSAGATLSFVNNSGM